MSVSRLDKLKRLKLLLILQVITIPLVILIFRAIEPRQVAAVVAGSWFVISGLFMVWSASRWPGFLRNPVFWVACIFAFGFSIPMVVMRIIHWTLAFELINIWGIPGPKFHGISNTAFLALAASTVWEYWKTKRA